MRKSRKFLAVILAVVCLGNVGCHEQYVEDLILGFFKTTSTDMRGMARGYSKPPIPTRDVCDPSTLSGYGHCINP
jgi:hypothetical protein